MGAHAEADALVKAHVPSHLRRTPHGRRIRVRRYTRTHRTKGTTFRFKDVGRYQVRFDNLGNFRGSRIIQDKPAHWIAPKPARRSTRPRVA